MTVMAKVTHVNVNAEGKPIPLDMMAICEHLGIKGMGKRFDAYKAKQAEAYALLDAMLADVEQAMGKAGTLDANMSLAPWFNFGQRNVVRVYGKRHGVKHAKAPTANSTANVAALFGGIARIKAPSVTRR